MKENLIDTKKTVSFKEELIEKILSSLDEDSVNFIKENQKFFKADYPSNGSYEKIGLNLNDLIDEDKYQIFPNRPIYFKEGLTHLKLLLSISSENEIRSFYKKIQNKKVIDPYNPDHAEISNILNRHLSAPNKKKNKPSTKVSLELLKNLEQMTTNSMKQNYKILTNAKMEYRQYLQKIKNSSVRLNNKLKERSLAEEDVREINEENKKFDILKKSLLAEKKRLRQLKIRIDLYSKYAGFDQKGKVVSELSPKAVGKEKTKHSHLLECFKDGKVEVKSVWKEIQKFSNNRTEISKKYSNISEALSQLERSLENDIAYKDSLMKEIKSFSSYAEHLDLEQQEKARAETEKSNASSRTNEQGKIKYKLLLESFKKQKIEVKNIWDKVQRFNGKRNNIHKKYSDMSEELLKIENSLRKDTAFKNSLAKEIKSMARKIKGQQSELDILNKLVDSHYSLQSCILVESDRTKEDLEVQHKILERYKITRNNIHDDFDINKNRYDDNFYGISSGMEKLYRKLDAVHQKNKKTLKQAGSLSNRILEDNNMLEDIKNELTDQLSPKRAEKLLKKVYKNRKQLTKMKNRSDEFEETLSSVRMEKDDSLFLLKEIGERHNSLTTKWQMFVELTREDILDSENLLMDIYKKLTGLRIELATTYELFEISCACNGEILKTIFNIHTGIENARKEILREIQSSRESLEDEERIVSLLVKEQQSVKGKYEEFCCKFNGSCLDRGDIDVLIYQNAQLEKKISSLCSKETPGNDFKFPVFKSSDYAKYLRDSLKNRLNSIAPGKKRFNFIPRLIPVESFPIVQTGVAVFLLLSLFSYLLVYNTGNTYDRKRSLLAYNFSTDNYSEHNNFDDGKDKIESLSNPRSIPDYAEKIDLFNQNNSENLVAVKNVNILQSNVLNVIPSLLYPDSSQEPAVDDGRGMENIDALWANYADMFDDLRFDSPLNAFRLFEMMMNRQTLDLTLMDSIQLLYSIRRELKSEEGLYFDRMFHEFIKFGYEKKEATLSILHNNRLIEKIYNKNVQYIYKGKLKPIAMLEEMNMEDFEKVIVPYIITNYKVFARLKKISVPENIKTYAKNLAQDIYVCAKKFRVPVTSLLTIAHQESFFISLLGDKGESASPFQIYRPTKHLIFKRMKNDGFKVPAKVAKLENHVTFATFLAAYHFASLIENYSSPIIDPISHKPTALIVNLGKSTKYYNGGKHYDKHVLLKQKKLERYLKRQMSKAPVSS